MKHISTCKNKMIDSSKRLLVYKIHEYTFNKPLCLCSETPPPPKAYICTCYVYHIMNDMNQLILSTLLKIIISSVVIKV